MYLVAGLSFLFCNIIGFIKIYRLTGEPLFEAKERKDLLDLNKKCQIDLDIID